MANPGLKIFKSVGPTACGHLNCDPTVVDPDRSARFFAPLNSTITLAGFDDLDNYRDTEMRRK